MPTAQSSIAITFGTLALLLAVPHLVTAQALPGPRAGLSQVVEPRLPDARRLRIVDDRHSNTHWQAGALIGGLIGAALAAMYNAVASDSDHQSLRVVEFTFAGAAIGGILTSKW